MLETSSPWCTCISDLLFKNYRYLAIGCLQSRDLHDDAQNPDGGQRVKSKIDENEESPYCSV